MTTSHRDSTAAITPAGPVLAPWKRRTLALLAAAATGALLALSFPPAMLWPLVFTALVPWLVALPRMSGRLAILSTFIVGGVWFGISLGWIANLSPFAFPVVVIALSVHLLVFALPARLLLRHGSWLGLVGTGALWLLFEAMRTHLPLPLPFPWLMLGDTQAAFLPIAQIAELGGVALVSALIVAVNLALARPLLRSRNRPVPRIGSVALAKKAFGSAAVSLLMLYAALAYGFVRMEQFKEPDGVRLASGPKVAVCQPNRVHRSDAQRRPSLVGLSAELTPAAHAEGADLIVWSEAVFSGMDERAVIDGPPDRESDAQALRGLLERMVWPRVARALETPDEPDAALALQLEAPPAWPYFMLGTAFETTYPHPHLPNAVYDRGSVHLVSPAGEMLGRYDKQDLVPMGEYVPFIELGFVADLVRRGFEAQGLGAHVPACLPGEGPRHFHIDPAATLSHSETLPNPFAPDGRYAFATPICYELAFPHTVRRLVAGPAGSERPADFLVNPSDESWYGRSAELMQMLHMGVMRCIENRRSLVRATNTGISAFIGPNGLYYDIVADAYGNVVEVGPAVMTNRMQVSNVRTPYQALGDWVPALALALAMASFVGLYRVRRRARRDGPAGKASSESTANASSPKTSASDAAPAAADQDAASSA